MKEKKILNFKQKKEEVKRYKVEEVWRIIERKTEGRRKDSSFRKKFENFGTKKRDEYEKQAKFWKNCKKSCLSTYVILWRGYEDEKCKKKRKGKRKKVDEEEEAIFQSSFESNTREIQLSPLHRIIEPPYQCKIVSAYLFKSCHGC